MTADHERGPFTLTGRSTLIDLDDPEAVKEASKNNRSSELGRDDPPGTHGGVGKPGGMFPPFADADDEEIVRRLESGEENGDCVEDPGVPGQGPDGE